MRNLLLAFGLLAFGLVTAAKAAPSTSTSREATRIQTPMGVFLVEAQLGYHACLFIPAEGVFYHPQRERARAQMRLWDAAEAACDKFNRIDQLTVRLVSTGENLNYREQAAIEVLLGWGDRTSLVAPGWALISMLEKIGRRFRRLQRL